jgi:opacity protein-like surface antigen
MNRALRSYQISLIASALALAAASTAVAADVYQWKDANGVNHYSQTPPPQGKFQSRAIYHREPSGDGAAVAATPAESPQCTTARRNIDLLQSGAKLQMDSDNDGKPDRDLSDADRDKQLQIAQTVVRVNCSTASAKAPGSTPQNAPTVGY